MLNNRRKVVYVVSSLATVGPTNQLYNIVKNLDLIEFDPVVLTLFGEPSRSSKAKFLSSGIPVESMGFRKSLALIWSVWSLRRRIFDLSPDVIHSQGLLADIFVFILSFSSHVTTLRNYPREDYPDLFGRYKSMFLVKLHFWVLNRIKVVACSKAIRNIMSDKEGVVCDVIQNGVDVDFFSPIKACERRSLRESLGMGLSEFYIVVVGSIIPRKNVDFILSAFSSVDVGANLIVLGDGYLRDELCNAYSSKRIRFVGSVDNVRDYYRAADLLVSASYSEGLPNAILEAMSCGLPCVLSDISQHLEIVSGDAVLSGLIFSLAERRQLESLIVRSVSTDLSIASKRSRDLVVSFFSSASMAKKYQSVYQELSRVEL